MQPPESEGPALGRAGTRPNNLDANRSAPQSTSAAIEQRCADCLATGEEFMNDARWLSAAGAVVGNNEVVVDLLAATLWQDIAKLHDEGAS